MQWREKVKSVEYVDPQSGERKEMPKADWDKLAKVMPLDTVIPNRPMTKYVWKQAFLGRDGILLENQPCKDGCTFKAMTGNYDRKERRFYGLLRVMMDPQKYANKWLSQTLHIINANAKGGVMYEEGAVLDANAFEEGWPAPSRHPRAPRASATSRPPWPTTALAPSSSCPERGRRPIDQWPPKRSWTLAPSAAATLYRLEMEALDSARSICESNDTLSPVRWLICLSVRSLSQSEVSWSS